MELNQNHSYTIKGFRHDKLSSIIHVCLIKNTICTIINNIFIISILNLYFVRKDMRVGMINYIVLFIFAEGLESR